MTSAPPAVRGRPTATLLGRFAIPLRYGGSSVKAEGVVSYVPPAGGVVTSLTSPMQPALGLTVALLPGRFPDVYLQNSGTTTVTVLGEGGEPFAQIGPQGVRVNLRSPIHDADLTARGQTPRVRTDLSAAPLWQDVSATPSYDWFDPRPHFLPSWTIPLHLGARTIPVQGVQRFAAPTTVSSLLASRHAPPEGRQFRHVGDPGDLSARRRYSSLSVVRASGADAREQCVGRTICDMHHTTETRLAVAPQAGRRSGPGRENSWEARYAWARRAFAVGIDRCSPGASSCDRLDRR